LEAVFCCAYKRSYLAGLVSIFAAKYGSIVIAVSVVAATVLGQMCAA